MSTTALMLQSGLIGLSIAAPVGPIGMLVIQRTLRDGLAVGLSTGLGAASADAVYGAIGAFGVHGLIAWLQGARVPLALGGAALLLVLAWKTWRASRPPAEGSGTTPAEPAATGAAAHGDAAGGWLFGAFAGTFALTLSNPATIVSFIAVFGSLASLQTAGATASPLLMVAGVWLGSALWWLFLCGLVMRLRAHVDARWQRRIGVGSALVLAAFALWTLSTLSTRVGPAAA